MNQILSGIPEKFEVKEIPPRIYYIPNFITENEENEIISKVYSVPKPKWTQLLNRRLQNWGGIPHPNGMVAEAIPSWLQVFVDKVNHLELMENKKANHVLINEYTSGQGIMPHLDGSLFYPTITTISCGSHTVINFHKKSENIDNIERETHSVLLERRSLFIVQMDMFHNYLHGINDLEIDNIDETISNLSICANSYNNNEKLKRGTRISLTIRHVPKTSKIKIKL